MAITPKREMNAPVAETSLTTNVNLKDTITDSIKSNFILMDSETKNIISY